MSVSIVRRKSSSALLLLLAAFAVPAISEGDVAVPVSWSWELLPGTVAAGQEAELVLHARLEPDWVVYSSDFQMELGPQPARLTLAKGNTAALLGPLRSIAARRKHDPAFNAEYGYFSERVELRQRVRLPADGSSLVAVLRGQACYEADGTCHLIRQEIRIASR